MSIPIRKYAQDWKDEYDVPDEVQNEVVRNYDEMRGEDWKSRVEFLTKIMDEYAGTDLEGWAENEREEIVDYELPLQIEEQLLNALKADPKGKLVADYAYLPDWSGEIAYEAYKGRGTIEENIQKVIPEIINMYSAQLQEELRYLKKEKRDEQIQDTVRHMTTPQEAKRVEIPTDPHKLENMPSEGLGSTISETPESWNEFAKKHISSRSRGMKKEATSPSSIVRALKGDSVDDVQNALTDFIRNLPWGTTPDKELHMTPDTYKDFVNAVGEGLLNRAREIMGVEKDLGRTNPFKGQWEKAQEEAEQHRKDMLDEDWHLQSDEEKKEVRDWWESLSSEEQYKETKEFQDRRNKALEKQKEIIRRIKELEKEQSVDDGTQKTADVAFKEPKYDKWEWEQLDKEESKLTTMFGEFADHRKAHNHSAASHLAELMVKRIPEYTANITRLFNTRAKERTPKPEQIEGTVEKLKMWRSIQKTLEEYLRIKKPHSKKPIGPMIRKKREIQQEANMIVELFKVAHELDKKGEYELADEVNEVVKSLAERVGISGKEMVAVADYFDSVGDTEAADKVDAMLVEAKKKKDNKDKEKKKEKEVKEEEKK